MLANRKRCQPIRGWRGGRQSHHRRVACALRVNGRRISVRPPSRRIIGGARPKPEFVDWVIQQTRIEAEHRRREGGRIKSFILVERFVGHFFAFVIGIGDVAAGSWVAALHEQPRAGAGIASLALTGLGIFLTTYGSQDITRALLRKRRTPEMARRLDDVMAALPAERREGVEKRALELGTLKDLRIAPSRPSGTGRGTWRWPGHDLPAGKAQ
jgi:hypothetical protein